MENRGISYSSKGLGATVLVPMDSCSVAVLKGQWALGQWAVGHWALGQWAVSMVGCGDSGLRGQWTLETKAELVAQLSYCLAEQNSQSPGASFYLEMHPLLVAPGLHSEGMVQNMCLMSAHFAPLIFSQSPPPPGP